MMETKRLNLLFVLSTLYLGGAQKVAYLLADALSQRHNVTIAYCFDNKISLPFHEKCSIYKLPDYNKNTDPFSKIGIIRKQIKELRTLKTERKIDVAISLGNTANYINARSKAKEQVICSERNNPKKSWKHFFVLTCISYLLADHIIFQTEKVRSFYHSVITRKSYVLKNPVLIPEKADKQRSKTIVSLGQLTPQKNQDLMIRSFARFHKEFPEYRLLIYGEGELRDSLEQLIASLDLSDHVFLKGNHPDVHRHIKDAEMFVLSSDFEGFPNALLECMSMGISCISTACEGASEIIRHGQNGLLTGIGDEDGLTQAMKMLAQDPELRMHLEEQAMSDLKAYDKDVVIPEWEKVIVQCAEAARKI